MLPEKKISSGASKCNDDYKPWIAFGYLYGAWRMVLISLSET